MTPRLLDQSAAAAYLSLPVSAVRRLEAGRVMIDGRTRWDRVALDAWLDERRGLAPQLPANQNLSDADAALERFRQAKNRAPRRS